MKKLLMAAAAGLTLAVAYVAYPILTVWTIREAVRIGDTACIETKIEWPTVRATLRDSLTHYALGPTTVAAAGSPPPSVGLWQRIKNRLSRRAVDNLVERYVTPEGYVQNEGDIGVKTYADLRGKRVASVKGAPALNHNTYAFLRFGGLEWSDVEPVVFGGYGASRAVEGPRLRDLHFTGSTEGAPIPRLYGRARLGGQVIWATDFE